ncbi:MAG: phytanoyl-CoA dioxygenase family protein [Fimbriimonadales bacterium]
MALNRHLSHPTRGHTWAVTRTSLEENGFLVVRGAASLSLQETAAAELAGAICERRGGTRNAFHFQSVRKLAASVSQIAEAVLGNGAFVVRAIFFDKTPGANWKVPWHQDITIEVAERREVEGFGPWSLMESIVSVRPPESILQGMASIRVHLDDCDSDNGPLRVIAGSHHKVLAPQELEEVVRTGNPVDLTCARGDVILMRPLLVHASSAAVSPSHRRVVHLDFASNSLPADLQWRLQTIRCAAS